jgi:arsenate reductase (glutaredoxin)
MLKIYHNPRCRKSREGLQYLEKKGVEFEVVDYTRNKFTADSLSNLLMLLNCRVMDIIRTQEEEYRLELKGKHFTDEEWIKILIENPKLIARPIIAGKYKAVLAIPPERMDILF